LNRPIYAIQARGIGQAQTLPQTLEEMAADYIQEIRKIQPHGPYHLLGWSFGGLVAHAITSQLQNQGEHVAFLALLDSYPTTDESHRPEPGDQEIIASLLQLLSHDPQQTMLALSEMFYGKPYHLRIADVWNLLRNEGGASSNLEEHRLEAIFRVLKNNLQLAKQFTPKRIQGDLLFVTAAQSSNDERQTNSWKDYISGGMKVYSVNCPHESMMQTAPIAEVGRILLRELSQEHLEVVAQIQQG